MHRARYRGLVRVLWALALGAVAGCAGAPRTVTADPHDPASQDPNPEHAASPVLESLDGQFFVTCGREPVALVASGGDNPLPIGFVERPAQVRAGARRGGQVAGAISSSLGVVNAWLPVERLGWYTAEDVELTGAPVYVSAGQRVCRRDGGSSDSPRVYVETRVGNNWTSTTTRLGWTPRRRMRWGGWEPSRAPQSCALAVAPAPLVDIPMDAPRVRGRSAACDFD
jgi:hypothetical protein